MSSYWDFDKQTRENQRCLREEKAIRTHRHVLVKVDGNKLICGCGEVMGFVRDPRKVANDPT